MKVVDFDKLFDEYVKIFLENNKGKYTEKQLENIQPKLFEKFSSLKIKNIGGLTPVGYYESKKTHLIDILKEHVKQDIPVNEFLQKAICQNVSMQELAENLNPQFDSVFLREIIEIIALKEEKYPFNRLIDLLLSQKLDEETQNIVIDILIANADEVAPSLVKADYPQTAKIFVAEILSNVTQKSDEVFNALRDMFLSDSKNTAIYCSFFIRYNDERILDDLYKVIEGDITYDVFEELRNAIEYFGGEYNEERDFSSDKYYKLIKGE